MNRAAAYSLRALVVLASATVTRIAGGFAVRLLVFYPLDLWPGISADILKEVQTTLLSSDQIFLVIGGVVGWHYWARDRSQAAFARDSVLADD